MLPHQSKSKEDNNQSKINKHPEVLENQIAWNSNNQGIKEKVDQNNWTCKNPLQVVDCEGGLAEVETETQSCGETPSPHESLLETGLEPSRRAALFPLWSLPTPHRQCYSVAKRVALPW